MSYDVVIVGAGHNGLVAATFLARAGLSVCVLERSEVVGGAVRTEYPFKKAPEVGQSTGAYLLGLMPPELIAKLGVEIPTLRRDPHYFLPSVGERYLLLGSDEEEARRQFVEFFSEGDFAAYQGLHKELGEIREDVAPTWLEAPFSIEETAERYVRPALRQVFIDLCRGSIGDYLGRFAFEDELIPAMYAVTDAFSGSIGGWDTPGSGMNFLVHNMCRLAGGDGTWMVVKGGMGTVTSILAKAAREAGAEIRVGSKVARIEVSGGRVKGVALEDGTIIGANIVVSNADPFHTRDLVGADAYSNAENEKLNGLLRNGSTLKVNLCLSDLPEFSCLPVRQGQHHGTIHLLPQVDDVLGAIRRAHDEALSGRLAEFPTMEWYIQTPVDPSLSDAAGRHSSALFVQWAPYDIEGSSWEKEGEDYARHLLSICDRFAPGTSELVEDMFILHPAAIEEYFGITRGHIHHVDNIFGFTDRAPYATGVEGLYACSAGCHPAGSVIGASGHNAAMRVLEDLEVLSR